MAEKEVWLGSIGPFRFDDATYLGVAGTGTLRLSGVQGVDELIANTIFMVIGATNALITADQNDYVIEYSSIRLSSDAVRTITGIDKIDSDVWLLCMNVGSFNINFTHEDALSTAINRILTPTGATVALVPNGGAFFVYDPQSSRWRLLFYS